MKAKREIQQSRSWYRSIVENLRWVAPAALLFSSITTSSVVRARATVGSGANNHNENILPSTSGQMIYPNSTAGFLEKFSAFSDPSISSQITPTISLHALPAETETISTKSSAKKGGYPAAKGKKSRAEAIKDKKITMQSAEAIVVTSSPDATPSEPSFIKKSPTIKDKIPSSTKPIVAKKDKKSKVETKPKIYQPSAKKIKKNKPVVKLPAECEKNFKLVDQGGKLEEDLSNFKVAFLGEHHHNVNNPKIQNDCMKALAKKSANGRKSKDHKVILFGEKFSSSHQVPCDSIAKGFNVDECYGWNAPRVNTLKYLMNAAESVEFENRLFLQAKNVAARAKNTSSVPKKNAVFHLLTGQIAILEERVTVAKKQHQKFFEQAQKKNPALTSENFSSLENKLAWAGEQSIKALKEICLDIKDADLLSLWKKKLDQKIKSLSKLEDGGVAELEEANHYLSNSVVEKWRMNKNSTLFAITGSMHLTEVDLVMSKVSDLTPPREPAGDNKRALRIFKDLLNQEVKQSSDDFNYLILAPKESAR